MKWKLLLRDYFNFSRKDRVGLISVITFIVLVLFIPDLMNFCGVFKQSTPNSSWIAAIRILETNNRVDSTRGSRRYNPDSYKKNQNFGFNQTNSARELFNFDPNTTSDADWKRLGLRDKTVHTIRNYLSKGGRFKKPEDVQRVYGLFPEEFERLRPYIRIKVQDNPTVNNNLPEEPERSSRKSFKPAIVDLNIADTTILIALPGIGSKLATRIINFRDKLGGFISVDQVKETFGLPDSTFQKIKSFLSLATTQIKQINLNTATLEDLKNHPYIRYVLANAIMSYKKEHGNFKSIAELKNIMAITNEIFQKISPYLSVE